ncbi:MAG: hypothetical protein ACTHKS_00340 [Gaiellaceae bacterium]
MSVVETSYHPQGQGIVRELWCDYCGYGVVVRHEVPACPMCRREKWRERRPVAGLN